MKSAILAISLGSLILFFWGFISWTVLPWHNSVANKFIDETAVASTLKSNAPVRGIYYLPFAEDNHHPGEVAAFVNVLPQGFDPNMGKLMSISFITHMLSVSLVLILLRQTHNSSYSGKIKFITLIGLMIGFVSHAPYWTWFGFSTTYVMITIFDTTIGWLLAATVIAKFTKAS